jgi:hypothetical protein
MNLPISCPRCNSSRITTRDYARKAGGAVGTVAGAAGSAAAALGGAETGAALGMIAGPVGSIFGGLAARSWARCSAVRLAARQAPPSANGSILMCSTTIPA